MVFINLINGYLLDPNANEILNDSEPPRNHELTKRSIKMTFQSVCPTVHTVVNISNDPVFRYRPAIYEEIRCAHPLEQNHKNKICSQRQDSACIQLYTTIFLVKHRYGSNCAESESRKIPSGCECMIPKDNRLSFI
jgi:hypothetical protein